jgi:hypothetical protein
MSGRFGSTGRQVVTFAAMVTIASCASAGTGVGGIEAASTPSYRLVVNNRSDFEVVVYAVQSASSAGYRLGSARSLDSTMLMVPRNVLTGTQDLVVRLHPIGQAPGVYDWVSQRISLDPTLDARLDIHADRGGDMALSMLSAMSNVGSLSRGGHR